MPMEGWWSGMKLVLPFVSVSLVPGSLLPQVWQPCLWPKSFIASRTLEKSRLSVPIAKPPAKGPSPRIMFIVFETAFDIALLCALL